MNAVHFAQRTRMVAALAALALPGGLCAAQTPPAAAAASPAPPASLAAALGGSAPLFQFRTRYEDVDQDNTLENAGALTLKSRLSYTTLAYKGWQAMLEADNVTYLGDDDFNSTSNNETGYSVVADPDGSEVNQAWIAYSARDTTLRGGRQRLMLDNERFVGAVGWRQNEQTYDGGSLVNKSIKNLTATYGYVYNVNRVFGPDDGTSASWKGDWESDTHLVNLSYVLPFGTLTAYDYLMEFETTEALAQSNKTWGVRFAGKHAITMTTGLAYTLEYASQEDHGDNPVSYDADYYLVEGALTLPAAITLNAGLEVLGGDEDTAGKSFRTPLATLHKFQGWADTFLATPNAGIQDRYVGASIVVLGTTSLLTWHDYEAEDGDASYGDEINASLTRKFGKYLTGMLKYADYSEDGFAVDTRKFWVQVQLDF